MLAPGVRVSGPALPEPRSPVPARSKTLTATVALVRGPGPWLVTVATSFPPAITVPLITRSGGGARGVGDGVGVSPDGVGVVGAGVTAGDVGATGAGLFSGVAMPRGLRAAVAWRD